MWCLLIDSCCSLLGLHVLEMKRSLNQRLLTLSVERYRELKQSFFAIQERPWLEGRAITQKSNQKCMSRLLWCLHTTTFTRCVGKRMCKLCDLEISSWKLIIPLIPFLNTGLLNFSTTCLVRHRPGKSRVLKPAPPPSITKLPSPLYAGEMMPNNPSHGLH